MIGIINASPLIFLGKLGLLNDLPKIFDHIYTTNAVQAEVLNNDQSPEIPLLRLAFNSWLKVEVVSNQNSFYQSLIQMNLHAGEAEVIVLAKKMIEKGEGKSTVILDDLDARDIAKSLGFVVTGTIGIILALTEIEIMTPSQSRNHFNFLLTRTSFRINPIAMMQFEEKMKQFEKTTTS